MWQAASSEHLYMVNESRPRIKTGFSLEFAKTGLKINRAI